ncbi:MAG: cyclic nucleotide-binding domain-containing protein [Planctomycetes bacterium]|nr:cyclic nucleotide-binding domain-containing protein [Planctomycetota bacterium]
MKNNRKNGKIRQGEVPVEDKSSDLCAYVIKGGKAKVFKKVDGKRLLIGTVGKGEVFGFGETLETVSVVADGKAKVEMITKNTFMASLNKLPPDVRNKIHAIVSDLATIADINRRLAALFQNLPNPKITVTDIRMFETESSMVHEDMRHIIDAIANRLRAEITKFNKLTNRTMPP